MTFIEVSIKLKKKKKERKNQKGNYGGQGKFPELSARVALGGEEEVQVEARRRVLSG